MSADYLLYGVLKALEMANMGAYNASKCLPIRGVYNIAPIKWVPDGKYKQQLLSELMDGIKYADAAYAIPAKSVDHAAGDKADVTLKPKEVFRYHHLTVDIYGRFHFPCNLNGYVAEKQGADRKIMVGFSGTENAMNWKTNIVQYMFGPDTTYLLASEIVCLVASNRRKDNEEEIPIHVYGHSLGGGLMQYAICNCHADNIRGFGYNSAGLSCSTYEKCTNIKYERITHLYQPNDVVFTLPFTFQIGNAVKLLNSFHGISNTHGLDVIRRECGNPGQETAEIR
ncbi:MAG TPA: hypothetical protein PKW49_03805 [Paludibacteraceae bacterium]|nr:hypothetical protein [Paludibacteraceae bacterium]